MKPFMQFRSIIRPDRAVMRSSHLKSQRGHISKRARIESGDYLELKKRFPKVLHFPVALDKAPARALRTAFANQVMRDLEKTRGNSFSKSRVISFLSFYKSP